MQGRDFECCLIAAVVCLLLACAVAPGAFHQPMVMGGAAPAPPFRSQPFFPPSLPELTLQLRTNSYSTAGMILLRVLDHFYGVLVLGGDRTSLQPTESMLQLLDEYILRVHPKRKAESLPRVTALEELRLVNSLRVYVGGPADKFVKLCVIDALFGTESDAMLEPAKVSADQLYVVHRCHHCRIKVLLCVCECVRTYVHVPTCTSAAGV